MLIVATSTFSCSHHSWRYLDFGASDVATSLAPPWFDVHFATGSVSHLLRFVFTMGDMLAETRRRRRRRPVSTPTTATNRWFFDFEIEPIIQLTPAPSGSLREQPSGPIDPGRLNR